MKLKNPVILALDFDTDSQAYRFLDQAGDLIGAVKIGPRLNLKYGSSIVEKAKSYAPVFVDNKYFDITSTVLAAIQTSFDSGATLATVHALNGAETLQHLSHLEKKLNQIRPFKILAVTILTSWSQQNFPENFVQQNIEDHVTSLVKMAEQAQLSGIVCSGHELSLFKQKNLFKVVPGIRIETDITDHKQDQKRVMTPRQAIDAGASGLVIGRSILNAKNPRETIQQILENISI